MYAIVSSVIGLLPFLQKYPLWLKTLVVVWILFGVVLLIVLVYLKPPQGDDATPAIKTEHQTVVNVYPSGPRDIDPSIKSFFQMPRYKSMLVQYSATFQMTKSTVFLYSITPRMVDNHAVLSLRVANEDSERTYYLDEPNVVPFTIHLRVMNQQFLIAVEGYDTKGVQIRTYGEK